MQRDLFHSDGSNRILRHESACIPRRLPRNSNLDEVTANNGAAENCSARHGSCYSYSGVYRIDAETQAIRAALAQYNTEFGAFPSGDSHAICLALTGNNPKSIRFIELRSVAPDGDLLDPWGTPYKIYFSGDWPLVRSTGPNKQFDASTKRKATDDYFGG